ncbi:hypothetical protein HpBTM60_09180 [Helicobacter pylori]
MELFFLLIIQNILSQSKKPWLGAIIPSIVTISIIIFFFTLHINFFQFKTIIPLIFIGFIWSTWAYGRSKREEKENNNMREKDV